MHECTHYSRLTCPMKTNMAALREQAGGRGKGEWSVWLIDERSCLTSCRVVCCRAGSTQEARGLASSCFCAAASSALASVRAPKESLGGATTSACGNSAWCCG